MAVYDLYSKRQRELGADVSDVYIYDELPKELMVQIDFIWNDFFEQVDSRNGDLESEFHNSVVGILKREYGCRQLPGTEGAGRYSNRSDLFGFFSSQIEIGKRLDVIEVSFRWITDTAMNRMHGWTENTYELAIQAVSDLNDRFKEHGVGYHFVEDKIIRIDSEFIHEEAVKPALRMLGNKDYLGPQQEFLSAYEHYRSGKFKEAMNDCLKAFESTMKTICDKRRWLYEPNATARMLIKVCMENKLFPEIWEQQVNALRGLLESGIPTGRNKLSGHGQGPVPKLVPEHLVAYMLHMTASTLLFLTRSAESK